MFKEEAIIEGYFCMMWDGFNCDDSYYCCVCTYFQCCVRCAVVMAYIGKWVGSAPKEEEVFVVVF